MGHIPPRQPRRLSTGDDKINPTASQRSGDQRRFSDPTSQTNTRYGFAKGPCRPEDTFPPRTHPAVTNMQRSQLSLLFINRFIASHQSTLDWAERSRFTLTSLHGQELPPCLALGPDASAAPTGATSAHLASKTRSAFWFEAWALSSKLQHGALLALRHHIHESEKGLRAL